VATAPGRSAGSEPDTLSCVTSSDSDTSAGPRLLGPADVRSLAAALGVRPTKQRGQNFVIDPNTVRRIVRAAGLDPAGEHVLEVGPGLGSLTLALLAEGHAVTAVEIDPLLAAALPSTIAEYAPRQADRFTVVEADAMTVGPAEVGTPSAFVANLPYNVAVPVLLHLFEVCPSLEHGLVMVQSEVADRLAAAPGSRTYGVPSAKAAWYAEVRRAGPIGRNVFWPAPNVDSGLVAFTRREPPAGDASRQEVFAVIEAAFSQRRKTIRSALSRWIPNRDELDAVLARAGIDPAVRGETLGVEQFAALAAAKH
jgi:16S rRNA (adenine1518-N6/adenine1519-N6)-dimethyltransferase